MKCICCDYSTDDKSNFNKHIASRKHKLIEGKIKKDVTELDSDLSKNIKELTELVQSLNDRLEKQEKQINEQKIQIDYIKSEIF